MTKGTRFSSICVISGEGRRSCVWCCVCGCCQWAEAREVGCANGVPACDRFAQARPVAHEENRTMEEDPDQSSWLSSLVRSLTCATPRKTPPSQRHPRIVTHLPGQSNSALRPIGHAEELEAMRRRAAALDDEIAGLRKSLGGGSAGVELADARIQPSMTTMQAGIRARAPPDSHVAPSKPSAAATGGSAELAIDDSGANEQRISVSGVVEELSRGIRRVVARAQSPGRQYGVIGGEPSGVISPAPLSSSRRDARQQQQQQQQQPQPQQPPPPPPQQPQPQPQQQRQRQESSHEEVRRPRADTDGAAASAPSHAPPRADLPSTVGDLVPGSSALRTPPRGGVATSGFRAPLTDGSAPTAASPIGGSLIASPDAARGATSRHAFSAPATPRDPPPLNVSEATLRSLGYYRVVGSGGPRVTWQACHVALPPSAGGPDESPDYPEWLEEAQARLEPSESAAPAATAAATTAPPRANYAAAASSDGHPSPLQRQIAAEQAAAEWHARQLRAHARGSMMSRPSSSCEASPHRTSGSGGGGAERVYGSPSERATLASSHGGWMRQVAHGTTRLPIEPADASGAAAAAPSGAGDYSAPVSPASVFPSPYQPSHRWGAPLASPEEEQEEPVADNDDEADAAGEGEGEGSEAQAVSLEADEEQHGAMLSDGVAQLAPRPMALPPRGRAWRQQEPNDAPRGGRALGEADAAPGPVSVRREDSAPMVDAPPPVSVGETSDPDVSPPTSSDGERRAARGLGSDGASPASMPRRSGGSGGSGGRAAAAARPRPLEPNVDRWSAATVGRWLSSVGLGEPSRRFVDEHVDGASLVMLSRDDLSALGVDTVGHRLQILRAVSELTGSRHPDAAAPTAHSSGSAVVRELRFNEARS